MSDQNGFRYLFDQLNMNAMQARLLATLNDLDFGIRYVKGKENRVTDALSKNVQVNHVATMSYYGTEL